MQSLIATSFVLLYFFRITPTFSFPAIFHTLPNVVTLPAYPATFVFSRRLFRPCVASLFSPYRHRLDEGDQSVLAPSFSSPHLAFSLSSFFPHLSAYQVPARRLPFRHCDSSCRPKFFGLHLSPAASLFFPVQPTLFP